MPTDSERFQRECEKHRGNIYAYVNRWVILCLILVLTAVAACFGYSYSVSCDSVEMQIEQGVLKKDGEYIRRDIREIKGMLEKIMEELHDSHPNNLP